MELNKIAPIASLFVLVAGSAWADDYLMAKNVRVLATETSSGATKVTLSYDLPCWASYIGTIDKVVVLGNPFNPAADFEIAIGVLLSGNKMNPCIGSSGHQTTTIVNANAVEGSFLGFRPIGLN